MLYKNKREKEKKRIILVRVEAFSVYIFERAI